MDLISILPWINVAMDVANGAAPASAGAIIYDVLQVLSALAVIAKAGAWIATWTETLADDNWWAALGGGVARLTAWLANLASNNTVPPRRR